MNGGKFSWLSKLFSKYEVQENGKEQSGPFYKKQGETKIAGLFLQIVLKTQTKQIKLVESYSMVRCKGILNLTCLWDKNN